MLDRVKDRIHRKQLPIFGPFKIQNYAENLLRKFGQCLNGNKDNFENCCYRQAFEHKSKKPRYNQVYLARMSTKI